jgi:hypothetical protein
MWWGARPPRRSAAAPGPRWRCRPGRRQTARAGRGSEGRGWPKGGGPCLLAAPSSHRGLRRRPPAAAAGQGAGAGAGGLALRTLRTSRGGPSLLASAAGCVRAFESEQRRVSDLRGSWSSRLMPCKAVHSAAWCPAHQQWWESERFTAARAGPLQLFGWRARVSRDSAKVQQPQK